MRHSSSKWHITLLKRMADIHRKGHSCLIKLGSIQVHFFVEFLKLDVSVRWAACPPQLSQAETCGPKIALLILQGMKSEGVQ